MTQDELNIIWLDNFEFLSYHKKLLIAKLFIEEDILKNLSRKKVKLSTIISLEEYEKLNLNRDEQEFNKLLKSYEEQGILLVTMFSNDYPEILLNSDNPPLVLYCKGNVRLLKTTCVAVVGTRKPTEYGEIVTRQFVKELANNGVTIVSGLASGIDTIAHTTALSQCGSTIAVIAGGFSHIYPKSNYSLYKTMTENNLVISESKPSILPNGYLFPTRNRIIAGISKAVLITEAGAKSGALHTKNYAIESNREVFAVPGKINSPESEGTNNTIKLGQAQLCTDAKDILDCLGINLKENAKKPAFQLDINEQTILNYILTDKKTYQEIADFVKLEPKELNSILMNMQMKGLVEKLVGNSYIAIVKN